MRIDVRSLAGLANMLAGIALGAVGAWVIITKKNPAAVPDGGTAVVAEASTSRELEAARARIAELEALLEARLAEAGEKLEGEAVAEADQGVSMPREIKNLADLVQASRPMLTRMTPMFQAMLERGIERRVAEMKDQLGLTDAQAEELARRLRQAGEDELAKFNERAVDPSTPPGEVFSRDGGPLQGEAFETILRESVDEEQFAEYQRRQLEDRAASLERAANREVDRLGRQLELDEGQKDQVFEIYARTSNRFDPSLEVQTDSGATADVEAGASREDAIRAVLRPDQQEVYDRQVEERRAREQRWRSFFQGGEAGGGER